MRTAKFTPEALIAAPRRSPGIPNASGTKILFTVSTYSFDEHKKTSQIRVLDVGTQSDKDSTLLYENSAYSSPVWVNDDEFLLLKSGSESGSTTLLLSSVSKPGAEPTVIQAFAHGLSDLKIRTLEDKSIAIALTGLATPDGEPFNPKSESAKAAAKAALSTARIYTKLFVRHWDDYVTENTAAIWYGKLSLGSSSAYTLSSGKLTNLLKGTTLESPVPPFGGAGDFALGPKGIAFVARDPDHNPALTTITNVYYVPLASYDSSSPPSPIKIETGKLQGYSASPTFSPDGNKLAFTRMKDTVYESDKNQLVLLPDVAAFVASQGKAKAKDSESDVDVFFGTEDGTGSWDARPDSILWSADGNDLYVTAERFARNALYRLSSSPKEASSSGQPQIIIGGRERLPDEGLVDPTRTFENEGREVTKAGFRPLLGHGSVTDVQLLAVNGGAKGDDRRLFVSMSSQVDSSLYTIIDPRYTPASQDQAARQRLTIHVVSSQSDHGAAFGLSRGQLGETWFKGANGEYNVHALVVRPSNFRAPENEGKTWPLAFLIHGGPQGAWADSWSTRWNPAVFAEQGYVVVAPNPTGSTSYGMALQDGIQNQWGGRPYEDLVKCFEHIKATMPYVDTSRAVALGASYGGYMINWIQGHALGRRFKALVCHDGVFSTLNQYSSEELFFPLHDFGGTLWGNRAGYAKWDPAQFTGAWATPMLVIHNELDYRLPVTEGLSMFNVLQSRGIPSRLLSFPDENHVSDLPVY